MPKQLLRLLLVSLTLCLSPLQHPANAGEPLSVVAAENFYGDLVSAIGGGRVRVVSILNSPDQDPHSFEATAATARMLSSAALVVLNGADYDPWMTKLLAAARSSKRTVIEAAKLVAKKPGDNPHIWYDPATMRAVAKAVAAALIAADRSGEAAYTTGLGAYLTSLDALDKRVAAVKATYGGAEVTATEPVFGYMATALGLKMRNERFQRSVMNETEPSARDLAAFEADLRAGKVRALFYNSQVVSPLTKRLLDLAKTSGVPVVGVTETAPAGKSYEAWMTSQLAEVEAALAVRTQ